MLVAVVAVGSTMFAVSRSDSAPPGPVMIDPQWQTLRDDAHGLSISYPADWQGVATRDASDDRPRPASFGPDDPWSHSSRQCTEDTVASVQTLAFAEGGKRLSVLVAIGPDVSARRRADIYEILDTLRVG